MRTSYYLTVCICVLCLPRCSEYIDDKDLNRIMPGKKNGTISDQFAYYFFEKIIKKLNFLIDLHTVWNHRSALYRALLVISPPAWVQASFGHNNSLYVRADMKRPETAAFARLIDPEIILHNAGKLFYAVYANGVCICTRSVVRMRPQGKMGPCVLQQPRQGCRPSVWRWVTRSCLNTHTYGTPPVWCCLCSYRLQNHLPVLLPMRYTDGPTSASSIFWCICGCWIGTTTKTSMRVALPCSHAIDRWLATALSVLAQIGKASLWLDLQSITPAA